MEYISQASFYRKTISTNSICQCQDNNRKQAEMYVHGTYKIKRILQLYLGNLGNVRVRLCCDRHTESLFAAAYW